MTQQTYLEWGGLNRIRELCAQRNAKHVFLVTGKDSFQKTGAEKKLRDILNSYDITHFCDFATNTRASDAKKGSVLFKKSAYDIIISIGGGSVIDMAKLIQASASYDIDELIDGATLHAENIIPHIAVPTTAGTGSEATHFAVVYRDKKKYSVESPLLLPSVAIVDPELTMSMPVHTTAVTGLDALSQAIEAFWSVHSNEESKQYAAQALTLITKGLDTAIHNPSRSSREAMAYGAHYAGKAINISKTTAPHALSYTFTSYFNVPHGHAVALTLGALMRYNMAITDNDTIDKRGSTFVKKEISSMLKFLGYNSVDEASRGIENIMKKAGLATKLSMLGMTKSDIDFCIRSVNFERMKNNPRTLTKEALEKILLELL